ncbi:MAG: LysR family transcriptional regulator [Oligoflexia bacterium]|nr:LysR family transcriptional regulator [Oligoflexia bacterium]
MRNLNLNRLFYFHTFVRKKNVVTAAKELLISQPALSAQLKQLENELDLTLFDRSTRNLDLTEKGTHLFYFTKQIFETCEVMLSELTPSTNESKLSLRIGLSEEIERPFCVPFISSIFHDKIPVDAKRFSVVSTNHRGLITQLSEGALDLVLSNEATEDEYVFPLARAEMPVVLAVPRSYRGNKTPVTAKGCIEALTNHEIGLALPSSKLNLRKEIDDFLIKEKISANIVFEADILAVLIRAVTDGIGASFLPFPYIENELKEGKVKIAGLPHGFWKESLWLLISKKNLSDPIFPEMQAVFEDAFKKLTET